SFEDLPEHIKDTSIQRLTFYLQFFQEAFEYISLPGLLGYEAPHVTYFRLAYAVNATKSLFQPIGIPRQIIVSHQMGALQVYAFTGSVSSDQDLYPRILAKKFLNIAALLSPH